MRQIFCAMALLNFIGCALALSAGTASSGPLAHSYVGYFSWPFDGESPQAVQIEIERQTIESDGAIVAEGVEHYGSDGRQKSVSVRIRVDTRNNRFELIEICRPEDFTTDSSIGQPLIGRISPSLQSVAGPELSGAESASIPDFWLRAVEASALVAH